MISNAKVDFLHETSLIFGIIMETCVEPYMFPCLYEIIFLVKILSFDCMKKRKKCFLHILLGVTLAKENLAH
jgi:hypothetical protein